MLLHELCQYMVPMHWHGPILSGRRAEPKLGHLVPVHGVPKIQYQHLLTIPPLSAPPQIVLSCFSQSPNVTHNVESSTRFILQ